MNHFKSVGKYKAVVKLYEGAQAEITVIVEAQEIKTESKPSAAPRRGRRHEEAEQAAAAEGAETADAAASAEAAPADVAVADDVPSSAPETAAE
jgi:hypothetical protein